NYQPVRSRISLRFLIFQPTKKTFKMKTSIMLNEVKSRLLSGLSEAKSRRSHSSRELPSGKKIISMLAISAMIIAIAISGCAISQTIKDKSGAQLWGENCNRCHNSPSMEQYGKEQWEVIGTHMRVRANV